MTDAPVARATRGLAPARPLPPEPEAGLTRGQEAIRADAGRRRARKTAPVKRKNAPVKAKRKTSPVKRKKAAAARKRR